ncbi:MAG: hypothetical protein IKY56_05480 [Alistipes sp.]|nr:hypothetical protein [Alistipes sp.]
MTNIYRFNSLLLVITILFASCVNREQAAVEDASSVECSELEVAEQSEQAELETQAVAEESANIEEQDTINLGCVVPLSNKEYEELKAAFEQEPDKSKPRRKKRSAPERKGYGYPIGLLPDIQSNTNYIYLISKQFGMYGDVDSITICTYEIKEENGKYYKCKSGNDEFYEFNERGDNVKFIGTDTIIHEYDSRGNLILSINWNNRWVESCEYDHKDRLVSHTIQQNLDDKTVYRYKYNSKGNLVSSTVFHGSDIIRITNYDNLGRVINSCSYFGDYVSKGICVHLSEGQKHDLLFEQYINCSVYQDVSVSKYNKRGRVVEYYTYNASRPCWQMACKYSYDAAGNMTYYRHWPLDEDCAWLEEVYLKYDSHSRIVEANETGVQSSTTCTYDSKGNLVLIKVEASSYLFKYDSVGNVVQRVEYNSDGLPIRITECDIAYRK